MHDKDKGYYPSAHDRIVWESAAAKFSITQEEVSRIYNAFTKKTADIEMKKIKKLPLTKQKEAMLEMFSNILKNNRDLPYYELEGAPTKELTSHQDVFSDEYSPMIGKIAAAGWTIPLDIDIKRFDDLKAIADDAASLDCFFVAYYCKGKFNTLCRKIKQSFDNEATRNHFQECIDAYKSGMYQICVTSLITLLEGYISEYSDDVRDIRVMRVCNFHVQEESKNHHQIKSLCWQSMYEFCKVIFSKSDFSQDEPLEINRHWIEHGRTTKEYNDIGCIKMFNALSTMTIIKQAINTESTQ